MPRCLIMAALFLTACAPPDIPPEVPPELLVPVTVICTTGDTERALGTCALQLRQGLNQANSQIGAIADTLNSTEPPPAQPSDKPR